MFTLAFNGEFQLEYPNEFLVDLEELKKKHNVDFFGNIAMRDLGNYVDFQKIEDNVIEDAPIDTPNEEV